jgi:hypothetical protein
MDFARSAEMYPPPVYSPTGLGVPITWYHPTTTTDNNNTTTNTTTQPEDVELAQTGSTPGTPKNQPQPRKKPSPRTKFCAALLALCALILLIYVAGCVITRLLNYNQRNPEKLFKAECEGVGGRVVVHKYSISGWGVTSVDCEHMRTGGKADLVTELRTRTRRLDMRSGDVYEPDSYGYMKQYRELMGPGLNGLDGLNGGYSS